MLQIKSGTTEVFPAVGLNINKTYSFIIIYLELAFSAAIPSILNFHFHICCTSEKCEKTHIDLIAIIQKRKRRGRGRIRRRGRISNTGHGADCKAEMQGDIPGIHRQGLAIQKVLKRVAYPGILNINTLLSNCIKNTFVHPNIAGSRNRTHRKDIHSKMFLRNKKVYLDSRL